MTPASLTMQERQSTPDGHIESYGDGHKSGWDAALSAHVWAMAQGAFDKGIAKPLDTVLEYSGAASLYESATGSHLGHLAGSVDSFHTSSERMAYAFGESIGENLPLLAAAAVAGPLLRLLSRAPLATGQAMQVMSGSLLESSSLLSHSSALTSVFGRSLAGTGSALINLSRPAYTLAENRFVQAAVSGFGQGFLTAEVGEHSWQNRWAAGAYAGGLGLIESKVGHAISHSGPLTARTQYGPRGLVTLMDHNDLPSAALAGAFVGMVSTPIESLAKSGHVPSVEEVAGSVLGHGMSAAILTSASRGGMLSSPYHRYMHASRSQLQVAPVLGM